MNTVTRAGGGHRASREAAGLLPVEGTSREVVTELRPGAAR